MTAFSNFFNVGYYLTILVSLPIPDVSLHIYFQGERGIQSFMSAVAGTKFKKVAADVFCIFSYLLDLYSSSLENYIIIMRVRHGSG